MSVALVERAYTERIALIRRLGARCWYCGVSWTEEPLEFDHLTPRTWVARAKNRWTRMRLYLRDAEAGVLGLACRGCNASASSPDRPRHTDPVVIVGSYRAPRARGAQ